VRDSITGQPEQGRLQVVEIGQIAHARHVFGQEVHRHRPLKGQIVQVVVEQHHHVATHRAAGQDLVPGARAMHHHETVGAVAVDHAVVDELAGLVEHAGVHRLARVELADVAGGGEVDQRLGMGADDVHLLQAGHIHQPRRGADGRVLVGQAGGIGPCGTHAVPVFEAGTQGAMAVGEDRKSP
jgi:hypothetical protein